MAIKWPSIIPSTRSSQRATRRPNLCVNSETGQTWWDFRFSHQWEMYFCAYEFTQHCNPEDEHHQARHCSVTFWHSRGAYCHCWNGLGCPWTGGTVICVFSSHSHEVEFHNLLNFDSVSFTLHYFTKYITECICSSLFLFHLWNCVSDFVEQSLISPEEWPSQLAPWLLNPVSGKSDCVSAVSECGHFFTFWCFTLSSFQFCGSVGLLWLFFLNRCFWK